MKKKCDLERQNDIFAKLRKDYEVYNKIMKQIYPDWGGDEQPIYKEVLIYAEELGIKDKLDTWIYRNQGKLNGACHYFKNISDVNIWFNKNLGVKISD